MSAQSSLPPYGRLAIIFHWLIGLAIPAVFGLGVFMTNLPFSPQKLQYFSWHKWAGVTIFMLAVLRLAWRAAQPAQTPLTAGAHMPPWQQQAALWTHRLLYVLMFAVPLSGWIMSSAKGVPTVYFGMWQLPDLVARSSALGERLNALHVLLSYSMAGIVVLHISAAVKHHVIDRDDVLTRMIPFLKPRKPVHTP